ncbi:MAG: hypothetical protein IJ706_01695 [Clostridia bacterium]|nr:hypothetical protein [Clostridia bacterium]
MSTFFIVMWIVSAIWLLLLPAHWIPNIIATIFGVFIPGIYVGIKYASAQLSTWGNIPWWGTLIEMIIAFVFTGLGLVGCIGVGIGGVYETRVKNGISFVVFTGLSVIFYAFAFFGVVFITEEISFILQQL